MDGAKWCIAETFNKKSKRKTMYLGRDITVTELRVLGIEIFVEDLTKDEANALLKLYDGEQS